MTGRLWECTTVQVTIPRDSTEFFPIEVKYEGQVVRTGLAVSVQAYGQENRAWRPADVDERNRTGVRVNGLSRGIYVVAVRSATGAVMDAGMISAR